MLSKKVLKVSISSNFVIRKIFFTRRALIGHSKSTLGTFKGHLGTAKTRALQAKSKGSRSALHGYSKGTPKGFGYIPRALQGNSRAFGLSTPAGWALEALVNLKSTWALGHAKHLSTLGTQALEGHLGTQEFGHLDTPSTEGILVSRILSC